MHHSISPIHSPIQNSTVIQTLEIGIKSPHTQSPYHVAKKKKKISGKLEQNLRYYLVHLHSVKSETKLFNMTTLYVSLPQL